ncbi:hypothetical protein FQZ97_956050 [compost metagenome]
MASLKKVASFNPMMVFLKFRLKRTLSGCLLKSVIEVKVKAVVLLILVFGVLKTKLDSLICVSV